MQRQVFLAPGEGATVQRIFKALHACFVTVKNGGGAGKGKQEQGGQTQPLQAQLTLILPQVVGGPFRLGVKIAVGGKPQQRQDPGGIMGTQHIHGGIEGGGRVVFPQRFHGVTENHSVAAGEILQSGGPERIVHKTVGLTAQEIPAPLAVSNFVGAVLPHLAQEQAAGLFFVHDTADLGNEPVRQFVRHVQPPAGGAAAKPVADHGILAVNDVVDIIGVGFLHRRQRPHAPPGIVAVRPVGKAVPGVVGGILALGRAQGIVKTVGVKIAADIAGVIENAVEHHADAPLFRFSAEKGKIRLGAQHGVDAKIVGRIIPVIGGRLKNRAEVQGGDTKALQVIQLGKDAGQAAAKKIVVVNFTVTIRQKIGRVLPVFMHPAVAHHALGIRHGETAKAVGKDLVGHALAKPGGRGKGIVIDRQLPALHFLLLAVAVFPVPDMAAVLPGKTKPVPDQFRR